MLLKKLILIIKYHNFFKKLKKVLINLTSYSSDSEMISIIILILKIL